MYADKSNGSLQKGWIATTLLLATIAVFSYLTKEQNSAWYAFAYPLPWFRENFEVIYLIDFVYFSALLMLAYWFICSRITSQSPKPSSIAGIFLAIGATVFLLCALNFEFSFLPLGKECVSRTMGSGISIEVCEYNQRFRNWIAGFGVICLIVSLAATWRQSSLAMPHESFK